MNWLEKISQEPLDESNNLVEHYDSLYPKAGSTVSGLEVLNEIPNTSSIHSTFVYPNYHILTNIREVPVSEFSGPKSIFYAADDFGKSRELASQIKASHKIAPLIIAVDSEGPYILEGAHRYVALHILGTESFPALIVIDLE